MRRTKSYKEHLLERLQTPEEVAGYINAVIEDIEDIDLPTFLLALREECLPNAFGER